MLGYSATPRATASICWASWDEKWSYAMPDSLDDSRTRSACDTASMKIEAITLREIRMPLVHFFETSFGRTTAAASCWSRVHCDGVEGWGECVAGEHPFYSSESIETAWPTLTQYLAPALSREDEIESGARCPALLRKCARHPMAKAALENALWDAEAHAEDSSAMEAAGRNAHARFRAASPSAYRIRSSNCWRRSRPNSTPAISASR